MRGKQRKPDAWRPATLDDLLDNALQLCNVAGPCVIAQSCHCLGRNFPNFFAQLLAGLFDEMPDQGFDIIRSLAKRGDRHHVADPYIGSKKRPFLSKSRRQVTESNQA